MHLLPNCPKIRFSMDSSDNNNSNNKSQTDGNPSSESDPRSQPSVSPKSSWSPSVTMQYPPRNTMETVGDVLGRWRQNVGETTKMAEDLAGNVWQHLKTGPSITDVAMERLFQGTKVLAEGGYAKIFQQTFDTVPEEQLIRSFACYLSTSAGPVLGFLYQSTAKLAFCSDNPLPYKVGNQTEWSDYKVIVPLHKIKAVNPSANKENPAEKYIQVISPDNHELWFMGFVNYEGAVTHLQEALQDCVSQAAGQSPDIMVSFQ